MISINRSEKFREIDENLPEELELTGDQWYEYHYYLKRNLFLLQRIRNTPCKSKRIYLVDPYETYIGDILTTLGFEVFRDQTYTVQRFGIPMQPDARSDVFLKSKKKDYDIMLLLNVIECEQENPVTFLRRKLGLLKKKGRVLLITENIAQFKSRLKLLLGRGIFTAPFQDSIPSYRRYSLSDLMEIGSRINLEIVDSRFVSLYPPFRMEPLTIGRYLLKYINYFAMKVIPGFRNEIFLEAEKREL